MSDRPSASLAKVSVALASHNQTGFHPDSHDPEQLRSPKPGEGHVAISHWQQRHSQRQSPAYAYTCPGVVRTPHSGRMPAHEVGPRTIAATGAGITLQRATIDEGTACSSRHRGQERAIARSQSARSELRRSGRSKLFGNVALTCC